MVGVEMGQQDQRQGLDAEAVQAPVHRSDVGPGVDQQACRRAGGDDQGVALTHVAGDHIGRCRWPGPHGLAEGPAEHDQAEHGGQRQGTQDRKAPQGPARHQQEHRQQHRTGAAGRPSGRAVGHVGGALADEHQPPHRPARQPDQSVTERWDEDAYHRGEQSEHGGGGHGRRGEQVGRQRDEADRPREARDDRRRRHPRRGAHRQGVRDHDRAAAVPEAGRPAGCQQHDGGGRGDRECEPGIRREPWIDQQQHRRSSAQRRDRRPAAPRGEREQGHRAHRGGTEHARAGPRQDHEAGQSQNPDDGLDAAIGTPAPQRPQHAGQHDRHVRPGHGGEMREPGPTEVGLQDGIHGPGVPDHESGEQSG